MAVMAEAWCPEWELHAEQTQGGAPVLRPSKVFLGDQEMSRSQETAGRAQEMPGFWKVAQAYLSVSKSLKGEKRVIAASHGFRSQNQPETHLCSWVRVWLEPRHIMGPKRRMSCL